MKFVSYTHKEAERAGLFLDGSIIDFAGSAIAAGFPAAKTMDGLLNNWEQTLQQAGFIITAYNAGRLPKDTILQRSECTLLSPVPHPASCRDGYAFRQHVSTARRNRGVEMIPEFDEYPVFYFTNHRAIFGEGDVFVEQDHLKQLDFELECAVVIGKPGRNIPSHDADQYIAGFMVMNDLSARLLQMEEMKLNLGPAKGKDFATTVGPYLVTPDELVSKKIETPFGNVYDLRMTARHNGKLISAGNMCDMNWTFAELIERASYGVDLFPGDVIGSGTVGTGCYLELNGTHALEAKARGELFDSVWLEAGDVIELEIESLGTLRNRIVKREQNYSILEKKKR